MINEQIMKCINIYTVKVAGIINLINQQLCRSEINLKYIIHVVLVYQKIIHSPNQGVSCFFLPVYLQAGTIRYGPPTPFLSSLQQDFAFRHDTGATSIVKIAS